MCGAPREPWLEVDDNADEDMVEHLGSARRGAQAVELEVFADATLQYSTVQLLYSDRRMTSMVPWNEWEI